MDKKKLNLEGGDLLSEMIGELPLQPYSALKSDIAIILFLFICSKRLLSSLLDFVFHKYHTTVTKAMLSW